MRYSFNNRMGKKKEKKKQLKTLKKAKLKQLDAAKLKSKCCKKFKKGEHKRCDRCPCFDLIKKVA